MSTISDLQSPPKTSVQTAQPLPVKTGFQELMETSVTEEDNEDSLFELVTRLEEVSAIDEEEGKSKKKKNKAEDGIALPPVFFSTLTTPISSQEVARTTEAALQLLLETMVSEITRIDALGISETTITLSAEKFPLFGGSTIQITEFSTAPKMFNIEISATHQAALLLEHNLPELMKAFDERKERFKINRLEISLRRKEKESKYDKGHREQGGGL